MKLTSPNQSFDRLKASLLYLGIATLITVMVWISVSLYASLSKPVIDPHIQTIIKPLNPGLDSQVLIDYNATRTRPPDQFQIISTVKEGNQVSQVIIDPFSTAPPRPLNPPPTPEPEIASESALPEEALELDQLTLPEPMDIPVTEE
jgi:hypothetical protein